MVVMVFVDHYSHLSYVHLQQSTSGKETLQAKHPFKAYAKSHGIVIKHYHADNGRFIEPTFKNHCKLNSQTVSYSGVNAHWQNAVAEKRIRDLQDAARTMLIHAKYHWPKAVNTHLWPYALRMANDIHMHTPQASGKSPISLFSQVASQVATEHFHPFACPVYVLNKCMQAGDKGPKWEERARVSIYIGNSPNSCKKCCTSS
jgi:hypothetical protein